MNDPRQIGPITKAMCDGEPGEAPAIIKEWYKALQAPSDVIFFWMAATHPFSWIDIVLRLGGDTQAECPVVTTPASSVECLLTPLAHEGRIRIMQALYGGTLTPTELTAKTGFRGGGLYHHLKELRYAAYVADDNGRYRLTHLGRQMLITVALIAGRVIKDRGEEGLAAGTWQEEG